MELLLEAPRELLCEAWCPEPEPLKALALALADRLPEVLALGLADRLLAPLVPALGLADRLPEPAEPPKLPPLAPALALPGRVDEEVLPTLLLTWPACVPELHALEPLAGLVLAEPPRLPLLILPVLILVL